MDLAVILSFFLLAVPVGVTPGPNNLMLMTSAAKFGARPTVPHALGVMLGFSIMVFVVALGLGEIFVLFPMLKTILKYAAAAYFVWMAWNLLGLKIGAVTGSERPMKIYESALFQWINPKAWAMASSFGAAFVTNGEGRIMSAMWLGLGCLLLSTFTSSVWVVFGQQLNAVLKRTGAEKHMGLILASLMIIAVVLFLL